MDNSVTSPLRCQSWHDFLLFNCGHQQEWCCSYSTDHSLRAQGRDRYLKWESLLNIFGNNLLWVGARKTNKAKLSQLLLVAEGDVPRVGSRITANVHWLVERESSYCGLMGKGPLSGTENWSKCENIPICTKKNLSLLYSTVLYLCIPSIFWGDNSPCVCCPDSFLPLSKGHVLLAIFSSFIHARTLTFLYDFMLFGCHFWCTCETSSKVIRTNCKYLLENSPYQFHGPLVCPALTAHQYLPSWSLWVIPSLRWLSATSLLSRMSFELFV